MSRKLKKQLRRIVIALTAFAVTFCADHILPALWPERLPLGLASLIPGGFGWLLPLGIFLAIYVYIGRDVLLRCFRNIRRGQVFDEAYVTDLYDEVSALYRLDQISTTAGKSNFGPLPRASVLLIVALALCWLGMGVYVGVSYLKKRKSNKNH